MAAITEHVANATGTRRFSEGIEQLPETPEKNATRRFSEGIEQLPETPEKNATRRFSEGIEQHGSDADLAPEANTPRFERSM
jgi:hypothetical protein